MIMADLPVRIVAADRDLTVAEARELTREIRDGVAELELMIVRAFQGRAWVALGYESWDDYVTGEFKSAPMALPREQRRAAVESLQGWGLSPKAIAPVVGVSRVTVLDDLKGVRNRHPRTTGLDGKSYPSKKTKAGPTAPTADPAPTMITCPTCGGTGKVAR